MAEEQEQSGLGAHIWKVVNYGNHAEVAIKYYMNKMPNLGAWQIFSHGPKSKKEINQDDPDQLYNLSKKIPLFIHSSYVTSPDKDLDHIVEQFYAGYQYGARGVIIHIPKTSLPDIIRMTKNMIDAIKKDENFAKIIQKNKGKIPRIIWEAKALKKSKESFESPEKWNALAAALKENDLTPDTIGLNIDTAHIYASGAKITTVDEARAWLESLSPLCMTYMKSGVLHLNGNHYHQDVRSGDKHMIPGSEDDKIWKNEQDITKSGCSEFIKWARTNKIPIILELKHDLDDIVEFATKFD